MNICFGKKSLKSGKSSGFTLIEVLVVVSIIGLLLSVTLIGLQGSRESARDARRKADIELIRTGLEFYKTDCKRYPAGNIFSGNTLVGSGVLASCPASNTYISQIPKDPFDPNQNYIYAVNAAGTTYEICAALENLCTSNCPSGQTAVAVQTCGGSSNCGSTCNFKQTNP